MYLNITSDGTQSIQTATGVFFLKILLTLRREMTKDLKY